MRVSSSSLAWVGLVIGVIACSDGSAGLASASGGPSGSGGGVSPAGGSPVAASGTSGQMPIAGAGAGTMAVAGGSAGTDGAGGTPAMTGGASMGGSAAGGGTGGTGGSGGTISMGGLRQGPFKMLMLSTALVYHHDSIKDCSEMLDALGKASAPERATISGLASDSTWTVDAIDPETKKAGYFSEVTADNLAQHEMFYSNNPTGAVFSLAPDGANKKALFQAWFDKGGAWAGQHSATDFENNSQWTWFNDHVDGGWFLEHDGDPHTPGTITWESQYGDHPILKGLTSPWNCSEEWYRQNRSIEEVPGFKVLAKVTVSNSSLANGSQPRPAIWITENAKGGRAFYTIRGHNGSTYAEPEFRQLMLRGILWSVHRLPGGN